ncbi:MAG: ribonuclease [Clostridia bacterium]|jgi:hypothetical protein|nr:ribonuclease [Clostridia bacterium]
MTGLNDITSVLTITGFLAFTVSVITQVTKETGIMKSVPTSLQVTVLSVFLSILYCLAYASYNSVEVRWYMIAGSVVGGFIVAFVAMFGWEKLYELYSRFKDK